MEVEGEAAKPNTRLKKLMTFLWNKYWLLLAMQVMVAILFFIHCKHGDRMQDDAYGLKGFEDTHVMIFIGFGFLMTFLKKYAYSSLGFNFLLAAFAAQWALFNQQIYNVNKQTGGKIHITKEVLVEADIAAATVLITLGALLGWTTGLQLIIITFFECIFFGLNFYIVGNLLHTADVGGSICIHTFGAYFGLGCSLALRFKRGMRQGSSESAILDNLNAPSYMTDLTAMIGSLFLFVYWPSFNSALTNSHFEYQRAVTNTYLSLMACAVTSFCMSSFVGKNKLFDMVHIQNSTLAGGVAIGALCNMNVSPGVALVVGVCAGVISVYGFRVWTPKMERWGLRDTCGVHNLHGMPGVFAGLLSAVFAFIAKGEDYPDGQYADIFPAVAAGQTAKDQGLAQIYGLAATLALSFTGGIVSGILARLMDKSGKLPEQQQYSDDVHWELPMP